ncbi:phosphate-starvation-inducible PsiE family protein [Fructilactobacillus vespulae]|uniref:phosphate-starvation-inducible PsiE family protein n=1 Tax=Fructilactobacillus vespulae TaxID=1249630 RepID=UPI0039B4E9B1
MKTTIFQRLSIFFKYALMLLMLGLGITIIGYFALNIYELVFVLIKFNGYIEFTDMTKTILSSFLCFEFLIIIKEYFDDSSAIQFENYLYIAVTALVRTILVYHSDFMKTLILSISIFILMIAIILYKRFAGSKR